MLKSMQQLFGQDIMKPQESKGSYIAQKGFSTMQLLQVYHHNYFENLLAALQVTYPTVKKLVGEEFLQAVGLHFIEDVPFIEGHLTDFGRDFPDYIAQSKHCESLPYLADVARLDWALEEAYNAEDMPSKKAVAVLHPSCTIVHSSFPILDLYQFDGNTALDINKGGQSILVWKKDYEVLMEETTAQLASLQVDDTLLGKGIFTRGA